MRYGVIDCGTNTFNLLIADTDGLQWTEVFSNKLSVRLGKGGFSGSVLQEERMARALDALGVHRETLISYKVDEVIVLATSAVRDASNARTFIQRIKELLGFDLLVVDGIREAELIFKGVIQCIEAHNSPMVIMDIGGGSTEFIIADHAGILWKESFQLGVSRLFEELQPAEVFSMDDLARLNQILDEALLPLRLALERHPSIHLVGASGSFDTLQAILRSSGVPIDDPSRIQADSLQALHEVLLASDFQTRLKLPGMLPMRAETMPLASALIQYVMRTFGLTRVSRSPFAMKEGVLMEVLEGKLHAQKLHDVLKQKEVS